MGLISLCLISAGCRGTTKAPPRRPVHAPDILKAVEKQEPPSEFQALRDTIDEFSDLARKCDKYYFADVKGERIKKWNLPVDVQKMEKLCDPLLRLHEKMVDEGAWRCSVMDEFLRLSARVADQYLMLAFRCKKVGVREKRPYIKRVNAMRDRLRADVKELLGMVDKVSRLSDDDLKRFAGIAPGDIPGAVHKVLSGLSGAVDEFVVRPIKAKRPTWRYSLRFMDTVAQRAVDRLRSKAPTEHMALAGPADALTREYKALVNFFTGAWYYEEAGMDRKVLKRFKRAAKAYRKAAARALKL
ncbi:MAG: hypothetical protein GXP54_06840 [Deltaproteobacteria bacterium]|nr:hypothetical protein [Deltaproteobacteria bacterium]